MFHNLKNPSPENIEKEVKKVHAMSLQEEAEYHTLPLESYRTHSPRRQAHLKRALHPSAEESLALEELATLKASPEYTKEKLLSERFWWMNFINLTEHVFDLEYVLKNLRVYASTNPSAKPKDLIAHLDVLIDKHIKKLTTPQEIT